MGASDSKREKPRRRPPAISAEERELQLISLAVDLAEKQLADGSASAQVLTHFLKLGTSRAQLELEKLKHENELLEAKTEAIQSSKRIEKLYEDAMRSMREYQGRPMEEDEFNE